MTKKQDSNNEDKCSKCGRTESETFWDFKDGSMLCDTCHNKYGDKWQAELEEEKPKHNIHQVHNTNAQVQNDTAPKMKTSTIVWIILGFLFLFFMIIGGCSDDSSTSSSSNSYKSTPSNSYCSFMKSDRGRTSLGQDCPTGEYCKETECSFVTVTTDAGRAYACDGICK